MKIYLSCTGVLASIVLTLTSCQTPSTNTTSRSSTVTDDPAKRVYTQNDLQDSGQAQPGAALRKLDPDVSRPGSF